jgi:hypothetical protein
MVDTLRLLERRGPRVLLGRCQLWLVLLMELSGCSYAAKRLYLRWKLSCLPPRCFACSSNAVAAVRGMATQPRTSGCTR